MARQARLDGRNRREACRRAEGEPIFETRADLDTPAALVAFVLSVNVARRHLTQGQRALVVTMALADIEDLDDEGGANCTSSRVLGRTLGIEHARIINARLIRECAPDKVPAVLDGSTPFDTALKDARERKTTQAEEAAQMARLHAEAPDLATRVTEETLALESAMAGAPLFC